MSSTLLPRLFGSNLFAKVFLVILGIVALDTLVLSVFTIPAITAATYRLDEKLATELADQIENLVTQQVRKIDMYREYALEARRRELKNLVSLAETYVQHVYQRAERGELEMAQAKEIAANTLRSLRYGDDDYIFVWDYNAHLASHPEDRLHGSDVSGVKDIYGYNFPPAMVKMAREKGEDFDIYWWRRLNQEEPGEKLTYVKHFPAWEWVFASGIYIDDIYAEVNRLKARMLEELRAKLHHITIGETGYMFVLNGKGEVVIHPNPSLENSSISETPEPCSGDSLFRKFVEAAATPEQVLRYCWDHPADRENFVYEKLSWVRYVKGFDWYIASSVYTNELKRNARIVQIRTLLISFAVLLISLAAGYYLVRRLLTPLGHLHQVALRVQQGDMSVRANLERDDEIGIFAREFDKMVARLDEHLRLLDEKVAEKTRELQEKNQILQALDQEKNEFLGIAAHDLKNPLQAIQGSAELINMTVEMEEFESKAEIIEFAEMIQVSSERMFDLITNLLDVNAIESGKFKLNLQEINILPTLQKIVDEYTKKASAKNITIQFIFEHNDYTAYVDINTVHQILDNIISNAVKYSPLEKQVYIRILDQEQNIRCEIQDEGYGLSQEDQAKLFGKFTRLSTKPTGGEHSTGLGLFIVAKLIDAMNGKVWCESELGHGATFIITFPKYSNKTNC